MSAPLVRVQANGLDFACHVRGDGPRLALLLHGFPDDAGSMLPLAERLAASGFTAVAPYLRGYAPTAIPVDGEYGAAALAGDVVGLIDALLPAASRAKGRGALVVGHDWGAIAGYAAANLDQRLARAAAPEPRRGGSSGDRRGISPRPSGVRASLPPRVERLVALSVPPARTFLRNLGPAQARRSAYMGMFQLPWLAERMVRRDDFAVIRRLWATWSPGFTPPPGRLDEVLRTLTSPGTLEAALGYYRALGRPRPGRGWRLLLGRLRVPTLVVAGERDGCIGPGSYEGLDDAFAAPRRFELVAGAGHFLPLEAPDAIAELVRGWRTN